MFQETLNSLLNNLTNISPSILGASFLFLVGIFAAKFLENLVEAFLYKIRLNQVLKRIGIQPAFARLDIELDGAKFFGEIVKWFIILLFLMSSSELLGLTQFSSFLRQVITYLPNIFTAGLIFIVAAFLADFSQKVVVGTLEKEKIIYSKFLGTFIRWIIWFFAILAILYQLRITPPLILAIFIGMVATTALTLGLAFGLGGKDLAARILKDLEEKFK